MSNTAQVSARSRIESLLDDNSFVEIGSAVKARSTNFNIQAKDTPADGVITGYGVIEGRLVYVYSQDSTVLNGTLGEMHAKKISNLYTLALRMGAPVIGLIDCAGVRLQEATDALAGFGHIYRKQVMASGVIPQITAIFGGCGGGLATMAALSDFTFMEEKKAKLFVNSPNALAGNSVAKCDTSAAAFVSSETGLVDYVGTEEDVIANLRKLAAMLPSNNEDEAIEECQDDLNRMVEGIEGGVADPAYVLYALSDNGVFFETKKNYAKSMVTGFIKLNGTTVGAVANRSELFDEEGKAAEKFDAALSAQGAEKAADFVKFCDAFGIPVLTLTSVKGYDADIVSEKRMAAAAAKLTYAFANATVPKVNVVVGDTYGSAYVTMNSKTLGADLVYAWPAVKIGMMDGEMAAKIMYADEIKNAENPAALMAEKAAEYIALQESADSAAARGYVDDIIEPADTRRYVIAAFEMLYSKREDRPSKKHGTV